MFFFLFIQFNQYLYTFTWGFFYSLESRTIVDFRENDRRGLPHD